MTARCCSFLLLCISAAVIVVQCDHHSPCPAEYDRWQRLNDMYLLCWKVDWSDESITFRASVATAGWLGLGFSPTGQMPNSDVVIGWVKNGQPYLQDRFARARATPPIDPIQNVQLISGSEANGTTTLTFKRKLKACEPNDRSIEDGTTRVIFSYNPNDPVSETSLLQHTVAGRANINLLSGTGNVQPAPLEDDRKFVEALNPNVTIPSKHTTYQCTPFKLPQLSAEAHIIQFAPIVEEGHEELVHHILMFLCNNAAEPFLGQSWDCDNPPQNVSSSVRQCRESTVITAWAVGGGPVTLPSKVGLPMSGSTGVQYVVMETHYNNEARQSNLVDSSGVRIVYTPTKRQYDGAILTAGARVGQWMLLPPGLNNIVSKNICPADCTKGGLPDDGVKVFGSMLHAHTVGQAIWVEHIRNGQKLPDIDENFNYDFDFQDTVFLRNEVTVLPGDELQVFCRYDTSGRKVNTLGGEGTNDEMCLAFFLVYPRPNGTVCLSQNYNQSLVDFYIQGVGRGLITNSVNASDDEETQWQQIKEAVRAAVVASEDAKQLYLDVYWNNDTREYFCRDLSGGYRYGMVTVEDIPNTQTPTSTPGSCPGISATDKKTEGPSATDKKTEGPTPSSGKILSSSVLLFALYAVISASV